MDYITKETGIPHIHVINTRSQPIAYHFLPQFENPLPLFSATWRKLALAVNYDKYKVEQAVYCCNSFGRVDMQLENTFRIWRQHMQLTSLWHMSLK